jgi:flavodoxin
MTTEIYYFSGTGNSLYVAKELQKLIPEADYTNRRGFEVR